MNISSTPVLWKQILKTNFTKWEDLADFLELTEEHRQIIQPKARFRLNLPLRIAQKIKKGELNDPLFRQFVPTLHENKSPLSFLEDPTADKTFQCTPKLLQKYEGRALLICTSACAVHCRYCFRQNYPYEKSGHNFQKEIELIAADSSLSEIILSGGDPLSLSNKILKNLFDELSAINHIKRIRLHTRFPIGIPERIDDQLLQIFENAPKQIWIVTHSNHPNEFDEEIWQALDKIRKLGIPILNQSVLLKGVNDNVETLKALCLILVDHGVMPYYLHQLDQVKGAAHFEVCQKEGQLLMEKLRTQLSGYAVPLYVQDIPGGPHKMPLGFAF